MSKGRYGIHGGQYIPETLMNEVIKLEEAYEFYKKDEAFNQELDTLLREYAGRPSLLYYAEKMTEDTLNEIRHLCHLPKAVAIGEIGLDYYWHKEEREHEIQKKMFRAQMEIAREEKMPFMIHSRDAARDTLELVKECMKEGMHGGIIHCFSYGKEMAREYLNMGLYLGIGGVVTFKNAKKLKEVVEYAPLEQLVLETDSPYLSPEPNRGKRNSSLNLPYVAAMIAELKGISGEEVIAVTEENAKRLLFRK